MNKKYFLWALLFCGLLAIATLLPFYLSVGSWLNFSNDASEWGQFGDYFGGFTGTLITLFTTIVLAATLYFQYEQISHNQEQILKQDLLLQLSKVDDEIEKWLDRKLATNSQAKFVEFRDIVFGITTLKDSFVSDSEFRTANERLLKLTCSYMSALMLYEDNINPYFVHRHYREKFKELVDYLDKNTKYLNNMASASLSLCKSYLDGTLLKSEEEDE